jgi:hypothetical protein
VTQQHKTGITREQIEVWLSRRMCESPMSDIIFNQEARDHITHCLYAIVQWYDDGYPLGNFLTAVITNNLMEAVGRADDTNIKALPLYCSFLYNVMPRDYRTKLTGGNPK